MKRFFVSLALVLLVVWAVRSGHPRPAPSSTRPMQRYGPGHPHDGGARRELAEARHQIRQALDEAGRAIDEARHEVRQARGEVSQAWNEARAEVRRAYREAIAADVGRPPVPPPPAPSAIPAREPADGLPVPIVPGTRVTEAVPLPPVGPGTAPVEPEVAAAPPPANIVQGQISATKERAEADARAALRTRAADWLEPEVPRGWTIPASSLQSLIVETHYTPAEKPYGTLYWAELKVDFSPERRATLVEAYTRELIRHRLASLGGALAFVLIGLGAVSGYIRADEATKGYYTNRLRMMAAAGIGAAGVIVYKMVA